MIYQVCPICNGLSHLNKACTNCGKQMDEIGKMEDYMDPYYPYMDKESFSMDNKKLLIGDHLCVHLYYCEFCNRIEYQSVSPIT